MEIDNRLTIYNFPEFVMIDLQNFYDAKEKYLNDRSVENKAMLKWYYQYAHQGLKTQVYGRKISWETFNKLLDTLNEGL